MFKLGRRFRTLWLEGLYSVKFGAFNEHIACVVSELEGGYATNTGPKALAYSETDSWDHFGWGTNEAEALAHCGDVTGRSDCKVIDVNGGTCKSGAGSQTSSQFFRIGNLKLPIGRN